MLKPSQLYPRLPLPAGLHRRLREIPDLELGCRRVERLYAAASSGDADPAAARHLAGCERCRTVYGALSTAFAARPPGLPGPLAFRLAAIARRRRPARAPWRWLLDPRMGFAASLAFAVLLTIAAGGGGELAASAGSALAPAFAAVEEQGEREGRRAIGAFGDRLSTFHRRGLASLETYGRLWAHLIDDSRRLFVPAVLLEEIDRRLPEQGDNDGSSEPVA